MSFTSSAGGRKTIASLFLILALGLIPFGILISLILLLSI
jgi:hypothetical protein